MYSIDNSLYRRGSWSAVIVGTGGTGGYVAEGLARLLPALAQIILVDFDRVEERNLLRQNFRKEDIGKYKSQALAERLTMEFDRPVAYTTMNVETINFPRPAVVIGCVDNGYARTAIAAAVVSNNFQWWIDAGNGNNFGQILVGNNMAAEFHKELEIVTDLPLPSIQRPEILTQAPLSQVACEEQDTQGPTINQIMGAFTVETVRRLYSGTLTWMQLLIDMDKATTMPVLATPGHCQQIFKDKNKIKIIEKER